jgi:hypothetical protein
MSGADLLLRRNEHTRRSSAEKKSSEEKKKNRVTPDCAYKRLGEPVQEKNVFEVVQNGRIDSLLFCNNNSCIWQ